MTKISRGLLISLVTLALCAVLAEGGLRLFLLAKGRAYDAAATRATIAALRDEATGDLPGMRAEDDEAAGAKNKEERAEGYEEDPRRYQLHPYTGYHLEGNQEVVRSSLEYLASPAGREAFTIIILGGSVATIFASEPMLGHERLEEQLEASGRLGPEVEVLPFACSAHKQPQQLEMLAYLLSLGARPDMVLNLHGYNEVVIGPANIKAGLPFSYPSLSYWVHLTGTRKLDYDGMELMVAVRGRQDQARATADRALAGSGLRSALLGRLALRRVKRAHAAWSAAQTAYVNHQAQAMKQALPRAQPPKTPAARDQEATGFLGLEESIALWYESSLLIQSMCRERGIRYLNAVQPAVAIGAKPLTQEERERGLEREDVPRVVEGYRMLRARADDLRAAGIEFHDMTGILDGVEETIYVDTCHLVREGNRILADALAEAVLAVQ